MPDIDLTRKPAPDKEALLAKATGADKRLRVPQPARPFEGVTGELPLPAGKLVGMRTAGSLTPRERETLGRLGWTDDMEIPANMADLVAQVEKEHREEVMEVNLPLPVDPHTPPPKMDTKDIGALSPAEQERFRRLVGQSAAEQRARAVEDEDRDRMSALGEDALRSYDMAQAMASRPDAPQPEEAPAPPPMPATVADAGPLVCDHCGWHHGMPDVAEPPHAVKMDFLHSMLGEKCFTHEIALFGGTVTAVFRALTTRELDTLFEQAWYDKQRGKVEEGRDFYERVNRYRLMLQLQSLHAADAGASLQHDLPDGLSRETNPRADNFWKGEPDDGETLLPQIETHIVNNVLRTETLFRVANSACNQFNRLVAKLEAMMDNDPFWRRTEPPS